MESTRPKERLVSLDVMRGITVAGMIMVNNPGSWDTVYAPLLHAEWNGLTPTDLVFPFFVFIMGISSFASMRKFDFTPSRQVVWKILKRSVLIFLVGILLGWFGLFFGNWNALASEDLPFFSHFWQSVTMLGHLRILGVMQRLALCYCFTSLAGIFIRHRHLPWVIGGGLVLYYFILLLTDGFVPGEGNTLCNIDRMLWGENHMYIDRGVEPEGLLSTIPAICHCMIGFCCGSIIFRRGTDNRERMLNLFLVGVTMMFAGLLLDYGCPMNKKIWSPTFVLTTCGIGASLQALLIWLIDEKKKAAPFRFFQAFGSNPLAIYVLAGILATLVDFITAGGDMAVKDALVELLDKIAGPYLASLLFALIFVGACYIVAYVLYKKKIYIKL